MALIKFLKENENTRKIFGKRELKIIEKQLFGINLTQSEKNRLSRDIRKKFDFISKVCGFKDEFKIKKGAEVKSLIQQAKRIILEHPLHKKINKIVVFGSVAENKITPKSDIDIAVEFNNISFREATLFRTRISGYFDKEIDIQVYNHLPQKIKREIDKKGRIIYKNENK